jgi:hypothetical protein
LEDRGGCSHSTPRLRAHSTALQFGRDILVWASCCLRLVPGAPIRIRLWVGDLCKCCVDATPICSRGSPVYRRAHQGMAEPYMRPELDQVRRLGRRDGVFYPDSEALCRPQDQYRITHWFGRGHKKEQLRIGGH